MTELWKFVILILIISEQQIKANNTEFSNIFAGLVNKIHKDEVFSTIFLQRRQAVDCVDENLQVKFVVPVLSWGDNKTVYLKGNYSSELLAIMCMNSTKDKELLKLMAVNLQHMRSTRIVVIINEDFFDEESNEAQLISFFAWCQQLKLLNINLLYRNFFEIQRYYSYTQFPEFQLEKHTLTSNLPLFPDRLKNLHGKIVLTLPDQIEPRTMLYTDANGHQRMSGYIGKLLHIFEEEHNCKLQLPFPYNMSNNHVIYLGDIAKAAFNDSIDIGASVGSPQRELRLHEYTYPLEIVQWRIMLPIELGIPMNILLASFMQFNLMAALILQYFLVSILLTLQMTKARQFHCTSSHLLDVICNDASLRGMLAQTIKMHQRPTIEIKYTYFLMFIGGLVFSTSFSTCLMKLLTVPPVLKSISNFDTAVQQNLKILLSEQEIASFTHYTGEKFWHKYKSAFILLKSYEDYQIYRRTLTRPFAYPVTSSLWRVIKAQQKYFTRDLYRLSSELVISNFILFGLPLPENSIYKDELNRLIQRVQDSGLLDCWFGMSFYDMVALKRISLKDLSDRHAIMPFTVEDLYWIWILYCGAMFIAILEFIVEKFTLKWICESIHGGK